MLDDGSRILLRGRRLHRAEYAGGRWPIVMTLEVSYPVMRDNGLPTQPQHAGHADRMLLVIDGVERDGVGVHVFGDTNAGLIREWFYVGSEDSGAERLTAYDTPEGWTTEVMMQEDPAWQFYDDLVSPIRGNGAGW